MGGSAHAGSQHYGYTGGGQSFPVPAGVTNVHVVAVGAPGGTGPEGGQAVAGAKGAAIAGDARVVPGQVLYVYVGGQGRAGDNFGDTGGGFNGGGGGGTNYPKGYGGGGATYVRTVAVRTPGTLSSRLVVAAGGGGADGNGGQPGGAGGSPGTGGGGQAGQLDDGGAGSGNGGKGSFGAGGAGGVNAGGFAESGGGGGGGWWGGGGGGAYSGGGGGSSFAREGGPPAVDTTGVASVTISYADPPPAGNAGKAGTTVNPVGGSAPVVAKVGSQTISPTTFAAAPSGPSVARVYGAEVSYTLDRAASVRFTVKRRAKGRRVKRGGKRVCAKPGRKNRKKKRCTRLVAVGGFSLGGTAGKNRFRFTGRVGGRTLKPGRYVLVATPTVGGVKGRPASVAFRIVR